MNCFLFENKTINLVSGVFTDINKMSNATFYVSYFIEIMDNI